MLKLRRRWVVFVVAGLLPAACPGVSSAQPALEQLEKQATAPTPAPPLSQPPAVATDAEPGYLGIVADDAADDSRGVRLLDVLPGAPAQLGGLQPGDYITSIDGRTASSLDEMAALLGRRPAGDKITFIVRRGQEVKRIDVTLGKRPPPAERRFGAFGRVNTATAATPGATPQNPLPIAEPEATVVEPPPAAVTFDALVTPETLPPPGRRTIPHPTAAEAAIRPTPAPPVPTFPTAPAENPPTAPTPGNGPLLGLRAVPITPEMQVALNLPEPRGALVVDVQVGSPAQRAGLPVEAVIVAADGRRIDSPADLATIVQARGFGAVVKLSYFRYGQLYERTVKLGDAGPVAGVPGPVLPPSVIPPPATPVSPAASPLDPPSSVPPVAVAPSLIPPAPVPAPPLPQPPPPTAAPSLPTPAPAAVPPPAAAAPETETELLRRRVRELEAKLAEMEAKLKEPAK